MIYVLIIVVVAALAWILDSITSSLGGEYTIEDIRALREQREAEM